MKPSYLIACLSLIVTNSMSPTVGHAETKGLGLILDFKAASLETSKAVDGPRTGGGGNLCALGLIRQTEALLQALTVTPNVLSKGELQAVSAATKSAKIYRAKELSLRGEDKDAINYPSEGKLFIANSFCEKIGGIVAGPTMALLLHEYLGLASINDENYEKSRRFLKAYYKEDERLRKGSNVFGWFQGDVPEKSIRNERPIPVARSLCRRQAADIAAAVNHSKVVVKNVMASEQYEPEGNVFEKVETHYVEGSLNSLVTLTSADCGFVNMSRVSE